MLNSGYCCTEITDRYMNAVVNPQYDQMMDGVEFRSPMFQRPFQYLQRFSRQQELRGIRANDVHGTPQECIQVLLQYVTYRCFVLSYHSQL